MAEMGFLHLPRELPGSKVFLHPSLQGMSLLATQYLFNRFSYSLVYCNKVNCVAVQDRQEQGAGSD